MSILQKINQLHQIKSKLLITTMYNKLYYELGIPLLQGCKLNLTYDNIMVVFHYNLVYITL